MILTKENAIPFKTTIQNIKNPEWGVWRLKEDPTGFIIQGDRGSCVLAESEFHFWEVVNA